MKIDVDNTSLDKSAIVERAEKRKPKDNRLTRTFVFSTENEAIYYNLLRE